MELLKIKDLLIIAENQTSELIEKLREKEKENEELRKENKELRKKIEELWSLIDVRVKEGNPFRRPEIRKRSKKQARKRGIEESQDLLQKRSMKLKKLNSKEAFVLIVKQDSRSLGKSKIHRRYRSSKSKGYKNDNKRVLLQSLQV
jgi:predicted transcriptional regulator